MPKTVLKSCVLFLFVYYVTGYSLENASTVDQRQTGDYNFHINLKDIKILALLSGGLGNSEDYDYNYDYAEMTIKPSPGLNGNSSTTTAKPSNTTVVTTTEKVVQITPAVKPVVTTNNSTEEPVLKVKNVTLSSVKPSNLNTKIPVQVLVTPVEIQLDTNKEKQVFNSSETLVAAQANCIQGYRKDAKGVCRPKLRKQPQQTLLRKLIQLSQQMHHPTRKQ